MTKFMTRQGLIIDDLKKYVTEWIEDKPNAQIFVGCDSQARDKDVDYAVSVCIYNPGKGGHIINKKMTLPHKTKKKVKGKDEEAIMMRLWREVEMAVEVANELRDVCGNITIHCDYNSKESELSNRLYASGIGYALEHGYQAAGKPFAWAATHIADNAVR